MAFNYYNRKRNILQERGLFHIVVPPDERWHWSLFGLDGAVVLGEAAEIHLTVKAGLGMGATSVRRDGFSSHLVMP